MSPPKSYLYLLLASLLFASVASYAIEGLYPDAGPTDGYTRVTVFSSSFYGLNYSDYPTPTCKFGSSPPQNASWIHCAGNNPDPEAERDQTCLNCESPPNNTVGYSPLYVSMKGDFSDKATTNFYYYTEPEVEWIEPFIGYKTGGTFVKVHGQFFADLPALGCMFGTIIVPATYVSSELVTCHSPPSDVVDASIPLKITQNIQQASTSKARYFYFSVPEISQLVPNSGPTVGGTQVYIIGRQMYPFQWSEFNVDNTSFVKFGEDHIVKPTLINTTHMLVTSPPSLYEGYAIVEITFNDQEWTNNGIPFYYYIPPYVMEIDPKYGRVAGGTNVTVYGANYYDSDEIRCRFGNKTVTGYYIDETRIWCITPPANESGYVPFALTLTKDRWSSGGLQYLYIDPPVIQSVSPTCGPVTGFTQVAVIGLNFVFTEMGVAVCKFGNFTTPATIVNQTLIYCDSPSILDANGTVINNTWTLPISVSIDGENFVEAKRNFTYYEEPTIFRSYPQFGPVSGNTNVSINLTSNLSTYCQLTCRFATITVNATLTAPNQLTCQTPPVTCPGQNNVQISLNGQQYTPNQYSVHQALYYYYPQLILAYITPDELPTAGGASVSIYGEGFLMSRNTTTTSHGRVFLYYQCKYTKKDGSVLNVTNATYVDDNLVICPAPTVSSPTNNVSLSISPNGQNWDTVTYKPITFYNAPKVLSVNPRFGKIKQKGTQLYVTGQYFACPDDDCSQTVCSFNTEDMRVVTNGYYKSSTSVICDIPPISRPETTTVQVSFDGIHFTTQNVTYTFYDAFVLSVNPPFVPLQGNTKASVVGYGFADTGEVTVQLSDPNDGQPLKCGTKNCTIAGTFISEREIEFTVPPQSTVNRQNGQSIGFDPMVVEVSLYNQSYTSNGVEIQYFQQPTVGTLTADNSSLLLHTNTIQTVRTPVTIYVPTGNTRANFLFLAKLRCKFVVGDEVEITRGIIASYPFPADETLSLELNSRIECPTPKFTNTGTGTVSISINGRDFIGSNPIKVRPELKINSVAPQCGPKEGGTKVVLGTQGFDVDDVNLMFFSWSTVCTPILTSDALTTVNAISTITPAVPYIDNSVGGTSISTFSLGRDTQWTNDTTVSTVKHYLDSGAEFLYYTNPIVSHIYPHSGLTAGGTIVYVEGAFFFKDTGHSCTPKCKFGNTYVEAEYISTTKLKCVSPPGMEGAVAPLKISMNGYDDSTQVLSETFAYLPKTVITSIHPSSGPESGGTSVLVVANKFVDLSAYPDEFRCQFTPMTSKLQPRSTPATFLNSTAIICISPGGWGAGTMANLQITYNGRDFTQNNNTFRFYQVEGIYPLGGPAAGGDIVSIVGSGFYEDASGGKSACKINGKVSKAISSNWTHIICPVPPSEQGPSYTGRADFFYTLDGKDWHRVPTGYVYYQQPVVSQLVPPFIAREGGVITVVGQHFLNNYYGLKPSCQIGNTWVPAIYVNDSAIQCPFGKIDVDLSKDQFLQVAMNDESFTAGNNQSKLHVFYITEIHPSGGTVAGGTPIQVEGVNFPPGSSPLCRFGVKQQTATTMGTLTGDNIILCKSAPITIPSYADVPLNVEFSLSFDDDDYKTWSSERNSFYYYGQPKLFSVSPRSAYLDQNVLVTITSDPTTPFSQIYPGYLVTNDDTALQTDLVCKFGRFGTSKAQLISPTQVTCPTPVNQISLDEINEETIKIQVAGNGQDFDSDEPVYFKFVGSRLGSWGVTWIIALIIGMVVLATLVFFIFKAFTEPSRDPHLVPKQVSFNPQQGGYPQSAQYPEDQFPQQYPQQRFSQQGGFPQQGNYPPQQYNRNVSPNRMAASPGRIGSPARRQPGYIV